MARLLHGGTVGQRPQDEQDGGTALARAGRTDDDEPTGARSRVDVVEVVHDVAGREEVAVHESYARHTAEPVGVDSGVDRPGDRRRRPCPPNRDGLGVQQAAFGRRTLPLPAHRCGKPVGTHRIARVLISALVGLPSGLDQRNHGNGKRDDGHDKLPVSREIGHRRKAIQVPQPPHDNCRSAQDQYHPASRPVSPAAAAAISTYLT
jgi:hypothetical protein